MEGVPFILQNSLHLIQDFDAPTFAEYSFLFFIGKDKLQKCKWDEKEMSEKTETFLFSRENRCWWIHPCFLNILYKWRSGIS